MKTHIKIMKIETHGKTDVEILKELTKTVIAESEKLVYDSYDDEPRTGEFFYDNQHLGYLEKLIDELCDILAYSVTYKPHLKLIEQIRSDIYMGKTDYFEPTLIEDVINDVAWAYFTKDEKVLDRNERNCKYHCNYIIRKLRPMTNKLAKIINDNELEPIFF